MKMLIRCVFLLAVLLGSNACSDQQQDSWQVAYKHDNSGNPLAGSKDQLFAAIRAGKSIRIGWGWYNEGRDLSIEHLASPIWLAIIDQKEVIAHLPPQVLSAIDWDTGTANYEKESLLDQEWRVVINTTGDFDAVWYDRIEGKRSRRSPQHHTITWFVNERASASTKPLFDLEKTL